LITSSLIVSAESARSLFTRQTPNNAKSRLLNKARALNNNRNNGVALTDYVVKFQKCQFVKAFDDDLAADEQSDSVLATRRFVIFRLCPVESCYSCNYGYGEYVIDLEGYLEYAVAHVQEEQEDMCNNCKQNCGNYNNNRDLAYYYGDNTCSCASDCAAIESMEDLGYVDAVNYLDCQQVYQGNDDTSSLYAGPMCSNSGEAIKIGIFTDEDCSVPTNKNIEDYLEYTEYGVQMQLSYGLFNKLHDESTCFTCIEENQNNNYYGYAESNELCEGLYQDAAKCESAYNFNNGYTNYGNYQNQAAQEEVVCKFISSLSSGTYDESGEIRIGTKASSSSSSSSDSSITSGVQKFFLTVFILSTVALAGYAAMLHKQITGKDGKDSVEGLAKQDGGTLA